MEFNHQPKCGWRVAARVHGPRRLEVGTLHSGHAPPTLQASASPALYSGSWGPVSGAQGHSVPTCHVLCMHSTCWRMAGVFR